MGTKEKRYFYGLQQQHKQLKIMEMNEAWPDIYNLGYELTYNAQAAGEAPI